MLFSELLAQTDRAMFAAFGEPVTYAPQSGSPVQVTGIFDERFVLAKGDAQAGVEATAPAVFFRFEDLPVDPEDDEPRLTIRGIVYRVTERMPDGMGGIVLALRKT